MQNGYAGDIGDYGKFALLRAIGRDTALRVGLHWWLTSAGMRANDGRHTSYLTTTRGERRYRPPDPELFDALRTIVTSGRRSVAALERAALIPGDATYFADPLDYVGLTPVERGQRRAEWVARGLGALAGCDFLLLDPDNGLEIASASITSMTAPKYVFFDEARAFAQGRSLMVYQHLDRSASAADQIQRRLAQFAAGWDPFAIRHHRGTGRAYVVVPLPRHRSHLLRAIGSLINTWPRDFSLVG